MPPVVNEESKSDWRLLDLSYGSVFENLAVEEALARRASGDGFRPTVRFWVNPPSVVLGRFQWTENEVDLRSCEQFRVLVARRFTGGGAVFHDQGNLNFTIVRRRNHASSPMKLYDLSSRIIIDALNEMGVEAHCLSPNSILIGGEKVAGSAAALGSGFELWHGSILVSSNLEVLERVLGPSKKKNSTRWVHSRWHPVSNLQLALGKGVSMDEVKLELIRSLRKQLSIELTADSLANDEEGSFRRLLASKYSSPAWNMQGIVKEG